MVEDVEESKRDDKKVDEETTSRKQAVRSLGRELEKLPNPNLETNFTQSRSGEPKRKKLYGV